MSPEGAAGPAMNGRFASAVTMAPFLLMICMDLPLMSRSLPDRASGSIRVGAKAPMLCARELVTVREAAMIVLGAHEPSGSRLMP